VTIKRHLAALQSCGSGKICCRIWHLRSLNPARP